MTAFDRLRDALAKRIRPCDCDCSAPEAPPIPAMRQLRILDTVRSSTCRITTGEHTCCRNTGASLQSTDETCHKSAKAELARQGRQERWAQAITDEAFDGMEIDATHIAAVLPSWSVPIRDAQPDLEADIAADFQAQWPGIFGPWDHPSFGGEAT